MKILLEFVDLGPESEQIVLEWLQQKIALKGADDVEESGPLRYVQSLTILQEDPHA